MKSKVFVFLAMGVSCLAEVRQTAPRETIVTGTDMLSRTAGALISTNFGGVTPFPFASAVMENETELPGSNPPSKMTAFPRCRVAYVREAPEAIWREDLRIPNDDILPEKAGSDEHSEPAGIGTEISVENILRPREVTLPIKITDVAGLSAALSQINTSLAALTTTVNGLTTTVNNSSTTLNNLSTTVNNLSANVSALSTTVQNLPPTPTFVDSEIPSGTINGSNSVFVLNSAPSPTSSLGLFRNGLRLIQGYDYSLSGKNILFSAGAVPHPGDLVFATYRH